MKKLLCLILSLLSVTALCAAQTLEFTFDTENQCRQIPFWKSPKSQAILAFEAKQGKTAPGCCAICFQDSEKPNSLLLNPQIKFECGKTYTAKCQVKFEGGENKDEITLCIQQRTANMGYHPNLPAVVARDVKLASECRGWAELSLSITIPADSKRWEKVAWFCFIVSAESKCQGRCLVDDFVIEVK